MYLNRLIPLTILFLSLLSVAHTQGGCPVIQDWNFDVNSTQYYQFDILPANTTGLNISFSIPLVGFYNGSTCINSTETGLFAFPYNGTLQFTTFDTAPAGQSCIIYYVCNEDDTCCSNATIVFNVTDIPSCNLINNTELIYIYGDGYSNFSIASYFFTPTNPIVNTSVVTPPGSGNYTLYFEEFAYSSFGNYTTNDTFVISACNAYDLCAQCNISLTILHRPVCVDDYFTVLFTTTFDALDPIANDLYVNVGQLYGFSSINVTNYANTSGSFIASGNGTVFYVPPTNYTEYDMSLYTVCTYNNMLCDTCTIYIQINSGIQCTSLILSAYSTYPAILDVLSENIDYQFPNYSSWILTIIQQPISGPATVLPNNTIEFISSNYFGNDSLYYTVTDPNGYNATCMVAIDILTMPVCGSENINIPFNTSERINITMYDMNPSGPYLNTTIGIYLISNTSLQGGTLYATGAFPTYVLYYPPINYVGADEFEYKLCDSLLSCVNCTFNVTILPNPTTAVPTTANPTTAVPTTAVPTTGGTSSTTSPATTGGVTTTIITTAVPTTAVPTTSHLTTGSSTTTTSTTGYPVTTGMSTPYPVSTVAPPEESSSGIQVDALLIIVIPSAAIIVGIILLLISLCVSCLKSDREDIDYHINQMEYGTGEKNTTVAIAPVRQRNKKQSFREKQNKR